MQRPGISRRRRATALALAGLLLAGLAAAGGLRLAAARGHYVAALAHLQAAAAPIAPAAGLPSAAQLAAVEAEAGAARAELASGRALLFPFDALLGALGERGPLPAEGRAALALLDLAEAGADALAALARLGQAAAPPPGPPETTAATLDRVLGALASRPEEARQAGDALRRLRLARARLPAGQPAGPLAPVAPLLGPLDQHLAEIELAEQALGQLTPERSERLRAALAALAEQAPRLQALAQGDAGALALSPAQRAEALAALRASRPALAVLREELRPLGPALQQAAARSERLRDLGALLPLVELATAAAEEAEPLLALAEEADAALARPDPAGATALERLPPLLRAHGEQLAGLPAAVVRLQTLRRQVPGPLSPALAPVEQALARFDAASPDLERAARLAAALPEVAEDALGYHGARTYLVLMQNDHELRATGGFIAAIGVLTLEQGRVVELDVRDSAGFDNPDRPPVRPPAPLETYFNFGDWALRDANWAASFPESAAEVERHWRREQPRPIHGVVAVTSRAVSRLLELVGPVRLPTGEEIAPGDVVGQLERLMYTRAGLARYGSYAEAKRQVMGYVHQEVLRRLLDPAGLDRGRAAAIFQDLLARRDILLWSRDDRAQQLLAALGWDGRVRESEGDYLYVVDSTMVYDDISHLVEKRIEYEVALDAEARPYLSTVWLTYQNRYDLSQPEREEERPFAKGWYWDPVAQQARQQRGIWGGYVRVLAPRDARLAGSDGLRFSVDEGEEAGRRVLGSYLMVEAGTSTRVGLRYRRAAPAPARPREYRLLVQAQPGAVPAELVVRVVVPAGCTPTLLSGGGDVSKTGVATWRSRLEGDREFALRLEGCGGAS